MMNLEGLTIGDIIAAGAVLMALWKFITWAFDIFVKPKEKVNKDIADIKRDITEIKEKLNADYKQLSEHEQALQELSRRDSKDIHNALRVILIAEQAVTKSLLENGNNKEGLRQAQKELNNYLQSKI